MRRPCGKQKTEKCDAVYEHVSVMSIGSRTPNRILVKLVPGHLYLYCDKYYSRQLIASVESFSVSIELVCLNPDV